jgi:hypothetical protein
MMIRLLLTVLTLHAVACADRAADDAAEPADPPITDVQDVDSLSVADAGFATPESVLHDRTGDIYLVSNISGDPLERDGDGFITRLSPDGTVLQARFIDGATEGVTLNAPKGMALKGDTLFVADIDVVRAFDRSSGASLGERAVAGASFLNDLALGPDGTLYVTDSGFGPGFEPTGTDAVYRFGPDGAQAVATGTELSGPNGIVALDDALLMVGFGGAAVLRIPLDGGPPEELATLPGGQLDGIVRLDDGTLLVSSWEAGAVFRVAPDGTATEVAVDNVEAPADIGWDAERGRLLIPLFQADRVEIRTVR